MSPVQRERNFDRYNQWLVGSCGCRMEVARICRTYDLQEVVLGFVAVNTVSAGIAEL
jgi:hypothetical protein